MQSISPDPFTGRLVGGSYRLLRSIGSGSMGRVYAARHERLGNTVAVKLLHASYQDDDRMVDRFEREAVAASAIRHPNVVQVYDFLREDDGTLCIVMEYIEGVSLEERLTEGSFSVQEAVKLTVGVLRGVEAAHQMGIVHRDLKPGNILLAATAGGDGVGYVPRIVDFGVAKLEAAGGGVPAATVDLLTGTPEYMSPEQCRGERPGRLSDIYSAGCILYRLLAGRSVFASETAVGLIMKHVNEAPVPPSVFNAAVPTGLDQVVLRALAKSPEHRLPSAQAFADALESAPTPARASLPPLDTLGDMPVMWEEDEETEVVERGGTVIPPLLRSTVASRGLFLAGAAAAAMVAVFFGLLLYRFFPGEAATVASTASVGDGRAVVLDPPNLGPLPEEQPPRLARAAPEPLGLGVVPSIEPEPAVGMARAARARVNRRTGRRNAARRRAERARRREPAPSMAEPEPTPEPAAVAAEPVAEAPASEPEPEETQSAPNPERPTPPVVAEAPRRQPTRPAPTPNFDAEVGISGLSSRGSLSSSDVRRAIRRQLGAFRSCYQRLSRNAGRDGYGNVSVSLRIDDLGRARGASASGGALPGLSGCVQSAAGHVVSRRRPDVGEVRASFSVSFRQP